MSKAYSIGCNEEIPISSDVKVWNVLKLAMGHVGKQTGGQPVKSKDVTTPTFFLVAADRDAAKKEICAIIDEIFDVVEEV